ncbi:unnamed protein product, partial [marine sediment metagenome]
MKTYKFMDHKGSDNMRTKTRTAVGGLPPEK